MQSIVALAHLLLHRLIRELRQIWSTFITMYLAGLLRNPTQARRVKLIAHVDAGASINASTTYEYGFYGAACTLYDTRDNALSQSKGAIESIAADGAGVINGTFSASGWIVLTGIAGSGSNYFTQALADAFYNGADITITDP